MGEIRSESGVKGLGPVDVRQMSKIDEAQSSRHTSATTRQTLVLTV